LAIDLENIYKQLQSDKHNSIVKKRSTLEDEKVDEAKESKKKKKKN